MSDTGKQVLTAAATASCKQQGTTTTSNPTGVKVKLVVAGQPVLLASGVGQWSTSGCQAQAGNSKSPCATVGPPTAGVATKLTSNGKPVLLASFSAPAVGSLVPHTVGATAADPCPLKAV